MWHSAQCGDEARCYFTNQHDVAKVSQFILMTSLFCYFLAVCVHCMEQTISATVSMVATVWRVPSARYGSSFRRVSVYY